MLESAEQKRSCTLLENGNQVGSQQNSNLENALLLQQAANAKLKAHITDVELKTAVEPKIAASDDMSFCTLVSAEEASVSLMANNPDNTALFERIPDGFWKTSMALRFLPFLRTPHIII